MPVSDFLHLFKNKFSLILFSSILSAAAVLGYLTIFIQDEYRAATDLYVLLQDSQDGSGVSNQSMNASQMLTVDFSNILMSDVVIEDVQEHLTDLDLSNFDVSIESTSTTRFLSIVVKGKSPDDALRVSRQFAVSGIDMANELFDTQVAEILETSSNDDLPCGPNRPLITLTSFLLSFVIFTSLLFLKILWQDIILSRKSTVFEDLNLLILGSVPKF